MAEGEANGRASASSRVAPQFGFCNDCGARQLATARFCSKCGIERVGRSGRVGSS